jgi:ribosomal protein S6--L-glutamate ligase
VTRDLLRLAVICGEAFGLSLYGVDVLETPEGPVVVDVNEFPNYTGVDEAPAAIGAFLVRLAEDSRTRRVV